MTKPKTIKLGKHETIIAVVPVRCGGPGWSNAPTWVYIRTQDGGLRQECIQPTERSAALHHLFHAGEAMCNSLIASIPVKVAK